MRFKKTILATIAAGGIMLSGVGVAGADHSVVDNPSGCHETNRNGGTPAEQSGQDPATSGWHNSAGGHDQAKANSDVHRGGDCPTDA